MAAASVAATDVTWPATWRSAPLWSMFERIKDVGHPEEQMLSVYREHGVVPKDSRDDNFNKTAEDRNIYQLIDEGWLVVNRMKAWQGSVGISPLRGIVSGHYICFRPRHDEHPGFLNWLLRSDPYTLEYARLSRGVRPNQVEIDNDELRVLPLRLPDIEEQRRIADFLDAETAQIDRLAAMQNEVLRLLQQRRARVLEDCLVSDVMSRGGRWVPLMYLTDQSRPIMYGIVLPGPSVEDGVPIVKGGDVAAHRLRPDLLARTTREIESGYARSRLRGGDLVIAIRGSVGEVALVPSSLTGANLTQDAARISIGPNVDHRWLELVLQAPSVEEQMRARITGATIKGINIWDLKRVLIPTPDVAVQAKAAAAAQESVAAQQALRGAIRRQLVLLAERKQALITAAVTGQFDVTTGRGVDLS